MPEQSREFRQKPDTGDTGKAPGSSQSRLTALERGRRSMADAEARRHAKATEPSIEEQLAVIEKQVEKRLKIDAHDEPSPPLNVPDRQGGVVSPGPIRAFQPYRNVLRNIASLKSLIKQPLQPVYLVCQQGIALKKI